MFWTSQLERRDCNRCHIAHETGQTERCLNGAAATISCPNGHATVCLWTYMVSSENSVFAGASTYTACNVSFFSACGCLPPSNQMFQQRRRVSHQSPLQGPKAELCLCADHAQHHPHHVPSSVGTGAPMVVWLEAPWCRKDLAKWITT